MNVGQLQLNDDRAGKLEAKVAFKEMDVQVTAEAQGAVLAPSDFAVLSGVIGANQR